ncbi:MAG: DNA-3-methyladenine glycosylase 2 family protein [Acidimicrobiia bacterium]
MFSGDYDLERARRFLEGWPPTVGRPQSARSLSWAAHLDRTWDPVAITVRQRAGTLVGDFAGAADRNQVAAEAARVLSVDIDGSGLDAVAERDPIAGHLLDENRGLRPVCFWTPYEAAVWGALSQRSSMERASGAKDRITREYGIEIDGARAFPSPRRLLQLDDSVGIDETKRERLGHVAHAALEGSLDSQTLRRQETGQSLAHLQDISGVGPLTAELILVRGAGHPDVFPRHERRLHAIMRSAYRLPDASVDELEAIADMWRPYRSWIGFLFRSRSASRLRGA